MGVIRPTVLAACVVLAACTAQQVERAKDVTLTAFKDSCVATALSDLAFRVAVGPLKISAADQSKEADIYATVQKVCDQAPADINLAFSYVTQAMAAISTGASTGSVPDVPPPAPAATAAAPGA